MSQLMDKLRQLQEGTVTQATISETVARKGGQASNSEPGSNFVEAMLIAFVGSIIGHVVFGHFYL